MREVGKTPFLEPDTSHLREWNYKMVIRWYILGDKKGVLSTITQAYLY